MSSWFSRSGRNTSKVVPSRARNALMAASWFSRQRREWMKYTAMRLVEAINSSNRGTNAVKESIRRISEDGAGTEVIERRCYRHAAPASKRESFLVDGRPQALLAEQLLRLQVEHQLALPRGDR